MVSKMSARELELRRRLMSNEKLQDTAQWFIELMAKTPCPDLSQFEMKFWRRIVVAFSNWQESREWR
jgi:hypothetical protein